MMAHRYEDCFSRAAPHAYACPRPRPRAQVSGFNTALSEYSASRTPRLIDGIMLTKFDTINDKVGAVMAQSWRSSVARSPRPGPAHTSRRTFARAPTPTLQRPRSHAHAHTPTRAQVGAALSLVYTTGKPIVFVGVGQTYNDIRNLNVDHCVKALVR